MRSNSPNIEPQETKNKGNEEKSEPTKGTLKNASEDFV